MPITTRQVLVSQLPDWTRLQKLAIPTTRLNTLNAVHAIGVLLPTVLMTVVATACRTVMRVLDQHSVRVKQSNRPITSTFKYSAEVELPGEVEIHEIKLTENFVLTFIRRIHS